MELSTAARARRRHRVPELVLQAAVDSVRQDPRQALAWFDTLARVHAADSSRVEERGICHRLHSIQRVHLQQFDKKKHFIMLV